MSLTVVKGMQSEIFVPITPPSVWAPVTKPLSEMRIALATAAGVHHKDDKRFNLAGDFSFRIVTDSMPSSTHRIYGWWWKPTKIQRRNRSRNS